jgi:plasmid stability protein
MKSLTIHNLDAELAQAIEELAQSTGLSQNKLIKKLLRQALRLDGPSEPKPDFSAYCGLWSDEEAQAFEEAIKPFEEIDENLWQ